MRATTLIAIVLSTVTAALSSGQEPAPAPQFPAEATVVTVDAVVLDRGGNPVRGLTADDFVVSEDGKAQKVTSFEAVEVGAASSEPSGPPPPVSTNVVDAKKAGRTFVVVFDAVHLTPGGGERAKTAIARFLRDDIREGDSVSLVSTAGGVWWTAQGVRGRDRLTDLLKGLRGGRFDELPHGVTISDFEAMRIVEQGDAATAGLVWRRLVASGAILDPSDVQAANATQSMSDTSGQRGQLLPSFYQLHPQVETYATQAYEIVRNRRRATLEVLDRVLESLATKGGRKSLLLVSEGFVADSHTEGFREVVEASRRANTAVYFFDVRGLVASTEDLMADVSQQAEGRDAAESSILQPTHLDVDAESMGADDLADETGGFSLKNANDLGKGFGRVDRESAVYYLLGYHPPSERRDGGWRKIAVEVSRKDVKVQARKGYFALSPEGQRTAEVSKKKGKEKEKATDPIVPVLQRAIDAPFDLASIPLRVSAYALDATKDGKVQVLVAADLDVRGLAFESKGDRYVDRLGLTMVILDLDSGKTVPSNEKIDMRLTAKSREAYARSWYPMIREFPLSGGNYQVRVVVAEENSRQVGSVTHEFEVPEPGGWRVTTPMVSDALDSSAEGGPGRPVPLARRVFRATGRLYCSFGVYGAANQSVGRPEVSAGFSLQTAAGREVLRGEPALIRPDSSGRLYRLIGIPIDGLQPGDYVLSLTFQDRVAGKTYDRREPLTIVAASASGGD